MATPKFGPSPDFILSNCLLLHALLPPSRALLKQPPYRIVSESESVESVWQQSRLRVDLSADAQKAEVESTAERIDNVERFGRGVIEFPPTVVVLARLLSRFSSPE